MSWMNRRQCQKLSFLIPTAHFRNKLYVLVPSVKENNVDIFYWDRKNSSWEFVELSKVPTKVKQEFNL